MVSSPWSGKTTSFHHKWNDTPNPENVDKAFKKVWFLDAQWTDCPVEVEMEVIELWKDYELGNDNCVVKTSISSLEEMENYPTIIKYILNCEPDIKHDDQILIHWWW